MKPRTKLLALALVGMGLVVGSTLALYYLPFLIAIFVVAVALIIFLSLAGGRIRPRRDARHRADAEAAQRGDYSRFLHDRNEDFLP